VSLLTELDAFYTEHRDCSDLDRGASGGRAEADSRRRSEHQVNSERREMMIY